MKSDPGEFRPVALEAAVELIIDHRGRTPKKLGGDFVGAGVQVISAIHVYGGRLHTESNQRYVTVEMARRWMPNRLRSGDVLLTSEAPMGQVAYLDHDADYCLGQRLFGLRARSSVVDGRYLYYALRSPRTQHALLARASGTTAQGIRQSELRQVVLLLPGLDVQRRIAGVLGALDDKIDSNRRLVRLLEDTAATAFVGWFGEARALGELEMADGTLGDLATLAKQAVHPAESPEVLFEHFSIPAFDAGEGGHVTLGSSMLSGKTLLPRADVVLLSKLNPQTKRVWWPRPSGRHLAVCSPEFLVLVPRPGIPASYLYATVASDGRFYGDLLSHATGTTGSRQRVRPAEALSCRAVVPGAEVLRAWDRFARPLYDHASSLLAENRTLAALRDTLMPRLTSGPLAAEPDAWPVSMKLAV